MDWPRSAAKTDRSPSPMNTKSAPNTHHAGRNQVSVTDTFFHNCQGNRANR